MLKSNPKSCKYPEASNPYNKRLLHTKAEVGSPVRLSAPIEATDVALYKLPFFDKKKYINRYLNLIQLKLSNIHVACRDY